MTTRQQKPIASFLTDLDLHLFNEGSHERIYEKLGAHPRTVDGVTGINFAVWAPNAKQVSVVGGFNYWNNTEHLMHKQIPSGIWELFVPNLKAGEICHVLGQLQLVRRRLDEQAFGQQRVRPTH